LSYGAGLEKGITFLRRAGQRATRIFGISGKPGSIR
jgi:hypothetical protein